MHFVSQTHCVNMTGLPIKTLNLHFIVHHWVSLLLRLEHCHFYLSERANGMETEKNGWNMVEGSFNSKNLILIN